MVRNQEKITNQSTKFSNFTTFISLEIISTDSSTRLISAAETSATVLKSRNATELSCGKVTDFSSVCHPLLGNSV